MPSVFSQLSSLLNFGLTDGEERQGLKLKVFESGMAGKEKHIFFDENAKKVLRKGYK